MQLHVARDNRSRELRISSSSSAATTDVLGYVVNLWSAQAHDSAFDPHHVIVLTSHLFAVLVCHNWTLSCASICTEHDAALVDTTDDSCTSAGRLRQGNTFLLKKLISVFHI